MNKSDQKILIALLAIGGIALVGYFLFKRGTFAMSAPSAPFTVQRAGGWSNEEKVTVVRNADGYIDSIETHRDVHDTPAPGGS